MEDQSSAEDSQVTSRGGSEAEHDRRVGDQQRQGVTRVKAEREVGRLGESRKGSTRSCEMLRDAKWDQAPVRLMGGATA